MIITIIALLIGIAVFCGGLYYFIQEKEDAESRKIYGIASAAGVVIIAAVIVKNIIPAL